MFYLRFLLISSIFFGELLFLRYARFSTWLATLAAYLEITLTFYLLVILAFIIAKWVPLIPWFSIPFVLVGKLGIWFQFVTNKAITSFSPELEVKKATKAVK